MKHLFIAFMLAALPGLAQWHHFDYRPVRPTGYFGLGFSTPANPVATRLNEGWNLAGGVGVTQGYVGVMFDAMFADFGFTDSVLAQAGARRGSERYWAFTVDPVFHVNERGPVDFYITGGGGLYGRNTSLRAPSSLLGQTPVRYDLISSETISKPGVDGGAGFSFILDNRTNARVFVEARYHHMFTRDRGSSFIPVTVGIAF